MNINNKMKIQVVKATHGMWYQDKDLPFKTDSVEAISMPYDKNFHMFQNQYYYYSPESMGYILKSDAICDEDYKKVYYDLSSRIDNDLKWIDIHKIEKPKVLTEKEFCDIFKEQKDFETKKFDSNKPSFSNIPQKAFWELMKVFKAGELKYGKYNHSNGCEHTRLTDGAVRHISQYLMLEDTDEETKTHHLANAAANCLMLLDQILNKKGVDNRNQIYK